MRAQSPIATAPSATTDGRITELHLWAVREGLRRAPAATLFEDSADGWLLPGCRFGALSSGCERYIRNGPATPSPGGAIGTWYSRCGASAAKNMIRTFGIAPISICSMRPAHETCHCACGVGWPVAARNAIFQFSRSWRSPGRLIISRTDPCWYGHGGVP